MFERYTEHARRVLFFARYEVVQTGGASIETEHLLLGLARIRQGLAADLLSRSHLTQAIVREAIEHGSPRGDKLPTSVEIPFSTESKRVLQYAAEEADRLLHRHIGAEHLLLGLLRQERSFAGSLLVRHGLTLDEVRQEAARPPAALDYSDEGADIAAPDSETGSMPIADVLALIDRIGRTVAELGRSFSGSREAHELVERIRQEIDNMKRDLGE